MPDLSLIMTPIPGLLVFNLPLHGDARGWFKENWQREKMVALGLPDFLPVQNNMSYNVDRGVTRGIHAEPWDKFVTVATGRVFAAWVDLREGETFGAVFSTEITPGVAVYVPRGVANSYQALEEHTVYSYLVNDHWSPEARDSYLYVNLRDPELGIDWPIPLSQAIVSDADLCHPFLVDVVPMRPRQTVIVGAGGQLGQALQALLPNALALTESDLDLTSAEQLAAYPWAQVGTIYNAAAYTAVDVAETPEGRRLAWQVNVEATARLVEIARRHRITLVHVSTDYVFDGSAAPYREDHSVSPLSVYGQTKAAADVLVGTLPNSYVVRTSWLVGSGRNFVSTMMELAQNGVSPSVVSDQVGRLTFASDLAAALIHLVDSDASPGVYHLSSSGEPRSWFEIAQAVFELVGRDPADVFPTTTAEYGVGKVLAPRPADSTFCLDKVIAAGFVPPNMMSRVREYVITALDKS